MRDTRRLLAALTVALAAGLTIGGAVMLWGAGAGVLAAGLLLVVLLVAP